MVFYKIKHEQKYKLKKNFPTVWWIIEGELY